MFKNVIAVITAQDIQTMGTPPLCVLALGPNENKVLAGLQLDKEMIELLDNTLQKLILTALLTKEEDVAEIVTVRFMAEHEALETLLLNNVQDQIFDILIKGTIVSLGKKVVYALPA